MFFNSFEFIFGFLPLTLLVFFALTAAGLPRAGNVWIAIASLAFYAWWKVEYLPLLLGVIGFNYAAGEIFRSRLKNPGHRKGFLVLCLAVNIGVLAYYKYFDFLVANINLAFDAQIRLHYLILPLGISFYILEQIAYIVDAYQGVARKASFLSYFLFVVFFPRLIAGPILNHREMAPQFESRENKRFNSENFARGLFIFFLGLFKKVIIADTLAPLADHGFDLATAPSLPEAWLTSLSYTFQLYFDFSGYSDMALGIGLMFNIKLPKNFDSPFKAKGMIEFWQRWHLSLSTFITTYLYTPLVRSAKKITFAKAMLATFTAMVIAGIWHGANWTFVVFGALHGLGLVVNHVWRKTKRTMPAWLAFLITFNYVNLTFVFFRAESVTDAWELVKGMLKFGDLGQLKRVVSALVTDFPLPAGLYTSFILLLTLMLVGFRGPNSNELTGRLAPTWRAAVLTGLLLAVGLVGLNRTSSFLYFKF